MAVIEHHKRFLRAGVLLWLVVTVCIWPGSLRSQETQEEEESFLGDEETLDEEQVFPDLVRSDETGGVMDELALLEESFLEEEVVSASKRRQSIFWSPSTITVYTREEIRSSGATNIVDFLRRVPGFDIYELKPSYPLLGARALTDESNNLVLVLIDGREALIESAGFTVMYTLCIQIDEVERIEVIRGPGSALYGSNAFTAVVNITTVPKKLARGADVKLSGGEEGRFQVWGRVRGSNQLGEGELSYSAAYGLGRARSPADRRDEILDLRYQVHGYVRYQRGTDFEASLHAGLTEGSGTFYTVVGDMPLPMALNVWTMGKARLTLSESVQLQAQIYYSNYMSDMTVRNSFRAYGIWLADLPDYEVTSPTVDGQVQANFLVLDNLNVITGANLRFTDFKMVNYIPSHVEELRGAVFAQASYNPWEPVQFTVGLRLDLSSMVVPALSPRAAVVLRPAEGHSFRASYGLAFRKPTMFESHAHTKVYDYNDSFPEVVEIMATQFGNESLTNEKVHTIEVGWQGVFLSDTLRLSADAFFNVYEDCISFVIELPTRMGLPDLERATLRYENVDTDIYAYGGEAEAVWRPLAGWSLFANLGFRRVIESGEQRPSEPVLMANLGARHAPASGFLADMALHLTVDHEMPFRDPAAMFDTPELVSMGHQLMLVGRLGYRVRSRTNKDRTLEGGLTVRSPLTRPFREFPGGPLPHYQTAEYNSDFGGEVIVRLISFYLRASF